MRSGRKEKPEFLYVQHAQSNCARYRYQWLCVPLQIMWLDGCFSLKLFLVFPVCTFDFILRKYQSTEFFHIIWNRQLIYGTKSYQELPSKVCLKFGKLAPRVSLVPAHWPWKQSCISEWIFLGLEKKKGWRTRQYNCIQLKSSQCYKIFSHV